MRAGSDFSLYERMARQRLGLEPEDTSREDSVNPNSFEAYRLRSQRRLGLDDAQTVRPGDYQRPGVTQTAIGAAPQAEDENAWRKQAFRAQNPYSSGMLGGEPDPVFQDSRPVQG